MDILISNAVDAFGIVYANVKLLVPKDLEPLWIETSENISLLVSKMNTSQKEALMRHMPKGASADDFMDYGYAMQIMFSNFNPSSAGLAHLDKVWNKDKHMGKFLSKVGKHCDQLKEWAKAYVTAEELDSLKKSGSVPYFSQKTEPRRPIGPPKVSGFRLPGRNQPPPQRVAKVHKTSPATTIPPVTPAPQQSLQPKLTGPPHPPQGFHVAPPPPPRQPPRQPPPQARKVSQQRPIVRGQQPPAPPAPPRRNIGYQLPGANRPQIEQKPVQQRRAVPRRPPQKTQTHPQAVQLMYPNSGHAIIKANFAHVPQMPRRTAAIAAGPASVPINRVTHISSHDNTQRHRPRNLAQLQAIFPKNPSTKK